MKRLTVLVLAAALPLACKPDEGKKDESATTTAPVEQKTEPATDAAADTNTDTNTDLKTGDLALDLSNPTQVVAAMGAAMVSVAEVKSADGVSLNPGTVAVTTSLALTEETCKHSGGPSETLQTKTGGEYAAYAAYCDLSKHPDGPDTTLGGIDRVQGVLCAIEGKFPYDGAEHEIVVTLEEKCFSKEFVAMAKEQNVSSMKQIAKGWDKHETNTEFGNAGYDRFISLKLAPGEEVGFVYDMQLSKKENTLSVAIMGGMEQEAESPDFFAISLDTDAEGSIRYEGRFSQFDDKNSPRSRHLRVLAKGGYDPTKKAFTSVDQLEYLYWDVYKPVAPSTESGDSIRSVKGSPGAGYKAISVSAQPAFELPDYVPADDDAFCYSGDCADNAGLYPTKEEDFAFAKNTLKEEQSFYSGKKFFQDKGPLAFESVTFAGEQ